MIYILNTELPDKKNIYIALQYIFGLGKRKVLFICQHFGLLKKAKISNISISLKNQIISYIEKNIKINEDLKQFLALIKEQQLRLKTYKGQRLRYKLPRRGQRTHTNAQTAKKNKT
jgi:small subunit ribosomal protein S13